MSEIVSDIPVTEHAAESSPASPDASSKRQREELDAELELSKKTKSDSPVGSSAEHKQENPGTEEKKSDDNKTITQHLTYEEITKMGAAQASAAGITTQTSHATVATVVPTANPSSTTVTSTLSPSGDTLIIEVSQEKVGQIIGSKGAIIQDMQTRTGAKIYVNQNLPEGVNRQVNITGTPQQVQAAGDLVRRVILEGPTAIHVNSLAGGPSMQITIECPQALVGRVIGGAGATIKELQSRSGAKIQINQDFPDGVPRKIMITGTQTAVSLATQLVSFVMENGPALPGQPTSAHAALNSMFPGSMPQANPYGPSFGAPAISPYGPGPTVGAGGSQTQTMECSKPMVGRIIGRKGETVTMLQQRSGAKIQIEQTCNPCKIMMTGNPQSIATAMQLINELINTGSVTGGMPGMGPYGGGMNAPQQQFGGYPPHGGFPQGPQGGQFGGYGAAPQQYQMQQYPPAYQGAPQQQAGYGQPQHQHYGGAPAAAASKPLPIPWSEHKTEEGNTYWYNSQTGTSQWERPV